MVEIWDIELYNIIKKVQYIYLFSPEMNFFSKLCFNKNIWRFYECLI